MPALMEMGDAKDALPHVHLQRETWGRNEKKHHRRITFSNKIIKFF